MHYISPALKKINHLISELEQIYHLYALKYSLSDSEFMILYTLSVEGGKCGLSDIVFLSGLPKQTVNSAIRKMEKEGIIFLSEKGKRRKDVNLTPEGIKRTEESVKILIGLENEILSQWGEEKVERYISDTSDYNEKMKKGLK